MFVCTGCAGKIPSELFMSYSLSSIYRLSRPRFFQDCYNKECTSKLLKDYYKKQEKYINKDIYIRMYAVVSYYNYRKEVSFTILKIFNSLDKAKDTALSMAKDEFGDEITDEVLEKWVDVKGEVINGYTTGDGYGEYVYTVVEIPDVE